MNDKIYMSLIIIIISLKITTNTFAQTITGKDWVKVSDTSTFSPRSLHQVVVFKDKLYLIGGRDNSGNINDIWCSDDGINWNQLSNKIEITVDHGASVVVLNDKLWMNTGKDIWNSSDGTKWNKVTTINELPKYGKSMAVFKNKIWLTGGWDNGHKDDVWSSEDGLNWVKVKTKNCFSKRSDHSVLIFKNKMWLIAGQSGPNKNDVWCSDDGISWNKVTDAPFIPRHVTQAVVFENKLWVIAGFALDSTNHPIMLSDVWSSSDGKNWENVTSSAPFGRRQEHQAVVFKNKLWVIGGYSGTFNNRIYKNDIWFTESSSADVKSFVKPTAWYWQQCKSIPEAGCPGVVSLNGKIYAAASGTMYVYDPAKDSWTKKGTMHSDGREYFIVETNGRIFAIGGRTSGGVSVNTVEEFDTLQGIWIPRKSAPMAVDDAGVVVYNGKIYIAGGIDNIAQDALDDLQVYDPENDEWETKTKMKKQRIGPATVFINGKIYAISGWAKGYIAVGGIEEYDINTDTWTEKAGYYVSSKSPCQAVTLNGKIYSIADNSISEYDPQLNKWTRKTNLISPCSFFSKLTYNNNLYIFGGFLPPDMLNKAVRYDPVANIQTYLPDLSEPKAGCGTIELNGKIFLIGGLLMWDGTNITRVEAYDTKN